MAWLELAPVQGTGLDADILKANVAGFVVSRALRVCVCVLPVCLLQVVQQVDLRLKQLHLLVPCSAVPMPTNNLLLGSLKWVD